MSDAKKCDRCGVFYEKADCYIDFQPPHEPLPGRTRLRYDLCLDCAEEFVEWANEKQAVISDE